MKLALSRGICAPPAALLAALLLTSLSVPARADQRAHGVHPKKQRFAYSAAPLVHYAYGTAMGGPATGATAGDVTAAVAGAAAAHGTTTDGRGPDSSGAVPSVKMAHPGKGAPAALSSQARADATTKQP